MPVTLPPFRTAPFSSSRGVRHSACHDSRALRTTQLPRFTGLHAEMA